MGGPGLPTGIAGGLVHNVGMSDQQPNPAPEPTYAVPAMEYLDASPPSAQAAPRRTRRWLPFVLGGLAFLVVLVGLGMVVGDWAARNVEMRALVSQIEVSEQAMADTQLAVRAAFEEYQGQDALSDADRAALDEKLQAAAAAGLVGVTAGGDKVAAVRVLGWHSDISAAQEAYLAHNQAWQDYLGKAAKDPAEFGVTHEQVNSTFAAAEQPMRDAVPSPDVFDLMTKVDVIYAPSPSEDSGPTQAA